MLVEVKPTDPATFVFVTVLFLFSPSWPHGFQL
jgi:hypothetical protein